MVLLILQAKRLRGVLEVFSSSAGAFSNQDVQTLQVLGRRVSETVQDAVEGGSTILGSDLWSREPEVRSSDSDPAAEIQSRESLAREIVADRLCRPLPSGVAITVLAH